MNKILNVVSTANQIVTQGYFLLKLYILQYPEHAADIDELFLRDVLNAVCSHENQGRKRQKTERRDRLSELYDDEFAELLPSDSAKPSLYRLGNVLNYAAKEMFTGITNNIKAHFREYVERFVFVSKKDDIAMENPAASDSDLRRITRRTCSILTRDILNANPDEFKSESRYHHWIQGAQILVLPQKKTFAKNSICYDIHCHAMDYLYGMLLMMEEVEQAGHKLLSFVPLRTSVIPKHVVIESTVLQTLFHDDDDVENLERDGTMTREQMYHLWMIFFKIDKKPFKSKGKFFQYMIRTDGVSCSVVLGDSPKKEGKGRGERSTRDDECEPYVEDMSWDGDVGKTIVGIDPNMGDLLYCSTEDGKKTMRFTQDERRRDLGTKRYGFIRWKEKTSAIIEGKNVEEWEATLSRFDHKTTSKDYFKEYVKQKLYVNCKIQPLYERRIFRRLKLSSFYNKRRSEQKLINKFKKSMGPPEEVVIGMGDWCQTAHRPFHEPVKGKGFRELFRKAGYKLGLIDEFRTSCRCSKCHGRCEKFQEGLDPNLKKEERNVRLIHGLLLCQQCGRIWNRDVNSAINIARLTRCGVEGLQRPDYLSRRRQEATSDNNEDDTFPRRTWTHRRHIGGRWFQGIRHL